MCRAIYALYFFPVKLTVEVVASLFIIAEDISRDATCDLYRDKVTFRITDALMRIALDSTDSLRSNFITHRELVSSF